MWSAGSSELPQKHWYSNHNNRKGLKPLQSHFNCATCHKVIIFCYFDVFFVLQPQILQVQAKIVTKRSSSFIKIIDNYIIAGIFKIFKIILIIIWNQFFKRHVKVRRKRQVKTGKDKAITLSFRNYLLQNLLKHTIWQWFYKDYTNAKWATLNYYLNEYF